MRTAFVAALLVLIFALAFSGCFPGSSRYTLDTPAGFFSGIWHGWIAPLSLIVGIFDRCIRIYEVHNSGWWYDFGFYIAVIAGFGGLALSRRRRKKEAVTP